MTADHHRKRVTPFVERLGVLAMSVYAISMTTVIFRLLGF
jgi:hypothetical protein